MFVTQEPVLVRMPAVSYPDFAREAGLEGSVVIDALLAKDGHVLRTFVVQPLGILTDAAVQAVMASTWRPAMNNAHPQEVWVRIPVRFSLNE